MDNQPKQQSESEEQTQRPRAINWMVVIMVLLLTFILLSRLLPDTGQSTIKYSYFQNLLEDQDYNGKALTNDENQPIKGVIESVTIYEDHLKGLFRVQPPAPPKRSMEGEIVNPEPGAKLEKRFRVNISPVSTEQQAELAKELREAGIQEVAFAARDNTVVWLYGLFFLFTFGLVIFMMVSLRRSQNQMMGGGGFLSNFSRSPAKKYEAAAEPVTFKDVAGLEGVKADLQENRRFPESPPEFPETRWSDSQGRFAERAPRHRENVAGQEPSRARPACRFTQSTVANLSRCSWVSGPVVCATFSRREGQRPRDHLH
jgi:cell division protease FtsH